MADTFSEKNLQSWIEILLIYAANFNNKGRRWFSCADIVMNYCIAWQEYEMTGDIRSQVGRLVSNLPKKGATNEPEVDKIDAILDIMVARGLLERKLDTIARMAFEITNKGREHDAMRILQAPEHITQKDRPKIVIIVVRDDEHRAVLDRLPTPTTVFAGNHRTYTVGKVECRSGAQYSVAVVRTPEQGPNAAQDTARDAIEDLDPAWIVLTGIGGGIPSHEFTLGDVVVATRLHDFSVGAHMEGAAPELTNQGGPMTKEVQDLLALLPALRDDLSGWESEESIRVPRPPVELTAPLFYGAKSWRHEVKKSLQFHFHHSRRTSPIVTTRAIASDGYLVKDTKIITQWKKSARDLIAVEMELSGVYVAARRRQKEYSIVAIRGISDIVGYHRNAKWTAYACESAGSFCMSLLKNMPTHFLPQFEKP